MDSLKSTCEIIELTEELDSKMDGKSGNKHMLNSGYRYSIEDDINRLFEAIDVRTLTKDLHRPHKGSQDALQKSALKKPIRVSSYQAVGIGISENVSLKQALRGLSISQASEMAAVKRLSKPAGSSRISEAGTIKRLYRSVVVEASGSHLPFNDAKGKFVEISLVTERITTNFSEYETLKADLPIQSAHPSTTSSEAMTLEPMMARFPSEDRVPTLATKVQRGILEADRGMKTVDSSFTYTIEKVPEVESITTAPIRTPMPDKRQKGDLPSSCSVSSSNIVSKLNKSVSKSPCLTKPIFSKKFIKKKVKQDLSSASCSLHSCEGKLDNDLNPCTSNLNCHTGNCTLKNEKKETDRDFVLSISTDFSSGVDSSIVDSGSSKLGFGFNCKDTKSAVTKADEGSGSRGKREFSRSSKSSIGNYSSSTSISGENNLSGSRCSGNRPHMSRDLRWEAIHCVQKQHGSLGLRHFKLLKRLGCGDIGTVYLAALTGTNCLFALKVMDNEFLTRRKKTPRAHTEREILQILDHPFLPTLYAHFSTDKLSCLVMEYCPGGDLHVLRQKQPNRSFSEQAARFFVAEVLLALEYLHMLGVVYRDLKAENILVREDGHIMLTDFDLSLRCAVNPFLLKSSLPIINHTKKMQRPGTEPSCIDPFCFQPSFPCFTPRILSAATKTRKIKSDLAAQVSPLPQLVVEPTNARSNSFVGTHEYLAPEIIKGEGHGSAVDWWTFGIFLFELLYGKTPFKGSGNEDTLANIVSRSLKFPNSPIISFQARDLIRGLLVKEPGNRLGSVKGAAEIKQHSFFEGINWALIRCAVPPELPKFSELGFGALPTTVTREKERYTEEQTEFDLF